MIGHILDKYRIIEKVGEGGMASVYRGEHLTLGREVAVKILHPHLSDKPRNRQRFTREARAIENLRHDNILRIEDYSGEDAKDCYIVTEFVDGHTLQKLHADLGAMPSEVVAIIGMHLADALQYAHDQGIIHRDLKPENVMIQRDGTIKLMDFGIARFLDEMHLTMTGALVGSPAYMSPEQAMEKVLDSRSDLFSLGTLLFHLVTGQLPFAGNNPSIVLRNIIEGNRPSVSDVAPEVAAPLAELIHSLLQIDPNDRPRLASEVRSRLAQTTTEADIDPEDPRWSLQAWVIDPVGYRERLDEWLDQVLLAKGKQRLEQRDHLGALQLFNRLLTIDERRGRQNEEVLALVSGMHVSREAPRHGRSWWVGGVALLVGAALLSLWLLPSATERSAAQPIVSTTSSTPLAEPEATDVAVDMLSPPQSEVETQTVPVEDAAPLGVGVESAAEPGTSRPALRTLPRPGLPLIGPEQLAARSQREAEQTGSGSSVGEGQTGKLTVHVPGSWGHIYIDGTYMGRTGRLQDPISVEPGTHTLTVKNDLALPYEQSFSIGLGETLSLSTPPLRRRPATLVLSAAVADECLIRRDGAAVGQAGAIGRRLLLEDPDQTVLIEIACPSGTTRHQVGPLLAGDTVQLP